MGQLLPAPKQANRGFLPFLICVNIIVFGGCYRQMPVQMSSQSFRAESMARVFTYAPDMLLIWQSGGNPGNCDTLVINQDGTGWYVFLSEHGWRRSDFRLDDTTRMQLQAQIKQTRFWRLYDYYLDPNINDGGRDIVIVRLPEGMKRIYGMNFVPEALAPLLQYCGDKFVEPAWEKRGEAVPAEVCTDFD